MTRDLNSGFRLGEWQVRPLEGVLSGPSTSRVTPKAMDVLLCLARHAGEVVPRDELVHAVWGERAVSDEPLTRCIAELRRALNDTRASPDYILTVPKRGYRLLKLPELPDGRGDSASAEHVGPQDPDGRARLKYLGMAAVLVVVAALVAVVALRVPGDRGQQADAPGAMVSENSIAVLPFANMSGDEGQEYFSDGISEELLNHLSRNPRLRVISRTSAFSYKGKHVDLPTIAAQLNIAYVLDGSVRKSGDRVRITAQLIDARNDSQLWSEHYDRTLDDIFAIQDEIAQMVVSRLEATLLGNVTAARTSNPDAYNVFLRARHVGRRFTPEDLTDAVALYRQALELDPQFSDAWVGLAGAYMNMATNSYVQPGEGFELAREAANKALAIDADNATAHAHLGWIAMWYDHDLQKAAGGYQRALALAPADSGIIGNAAILLKGLGQIDKATELTRYQVARDPLNATAHFNLGLMLIASARWDEAIESLNTALQLSPDYYAARSFIGTAMLLRGDIELALDAMRNEPSEPNRWLGLVMVHHASGDSMASDTVLADLVDRYEEQWAYNIAYVLAYRNDVDAAFEWLDKAVEYGDPGLADIVGEILFTNLHADPRWDALLRRIGRSPEDLRDIEFDVPMPE